MPLKRCRNLFGVVSGKAAGGGVRGQSSVRAFGHEKSAPLDVMFNST